MPIRHRPKTPPDVVADVLAACRRRCCLCYGLRKDGAEKKGQIAHLDRTPSNNAVENLAFLCLEHHDEYDSRTSQSKGLTIEEVKCYRTALLAFVSQSTPPADADIVRVLTEAFDRPAFRTPFHMESSLPRFHAAIAETIQTLNTGRTPQGTQLPSKMQIRDAGLRSQIEGLIEALVALRASFDNLVRRGEIRHCGCQDPDCPVHFLSEDAIREMDTRRRNLFTLAHSLNSNSPKDFHQML